MLGIYAEQDSRVNASRDAAEAALEAAGLEHELRTFDRLLQRQDATQADARLAWFDEHLA